MIQLNQVSFSYEKNKQIFNNINYIFHDNGIYSIVAKSGFGKTTLLNIISSLLKPTKGEILFSNDLIAEQKSITSIFQDNNLLEKISVYENISTILGMRNITFDDNILDIELKKIGILDCKHKLVSNLSGGERQRVCILIAVMSGSKVILADEPFSSLDEQNSINIMSIFKELSKDRLIIITTHNLILAKEYSDYIIDLEHDNLSTIIPLQDNLFIAKKNKNTILNIKKIINLHKLIFKNNIFQFVFSVVLLSVLFCLLFMTFITTQFSEDNIFEKVINAEPYNYFILNDYYDDNIIESEFNNQYKFILSNILSLTDDFYDYNPYKPDNSFFNSNLTMNYVLSDKYENNHIGITDCIAYNLRYYDIVSFNDLDDIKGKAINTRYGKLIIDDVKLTSFSYKIINESEAGSNYINTIIYGNNDLYKKIYYEKNSNSSNFSIGNEPSRMFYLESDNNLNEDEIIISKAALNKITSELYFVGDELELDCFRDNFCIKSDFIIKDIIDDNVFPLMYISNKKNQYLMDKWFDEYGINKYIEGLYFDAPTAYTITKINEILSKENTTITGFNFYNEAQYLVDQFSYLKEFSIILMSFSFIVSIIWITYLVYSKYKYVRKDLLTLEINGLSKINQFFLFCLEFFYQIFFSLILNVFLIIMLTNIINININNMIKNVILYDCFNIIYVIYSLLIILTTVFINVTLVYVFSLFRKKKAHIV